MSKRSRRKRNNPGNIDPVSVLSAGDNQLAASLAFRLGVAGLGKLEKSQGIPGLTDAISPVLANTAMHIFGNAELGLPQEMMPILGLAGRLLSGELGSSGQQVQQEQMQQTPVQQTEASPKYEYETPVNKPTASPTPSSSNVRISDLLYRSR